jgi:hypothetical protein
MLSEAAESEMKRLNEIKQAKKQAAEEAEIEA